MTRLDQFEGGFLPAIDEALRHPAVHSEDEIQGIRSESRDLHDLGGSAAGEAAKPGSGFDVVEGDHGSEYSANRPYQIPSDGPGGPSAGKISAVLARVLSEPGRRDGGVGQAFAGAVIDVISTRSPSPRHLRASRRV